MFSFIGWQTEEQKDYQNKLFLIYTLFSPYLIIQGQTYILITSPLNISAQSGKIEQI